MIELPAPFIERTRRLLGADYDKFAAALDSESPVSLRLNPGKSHPTEVLGEAVPWAAPGYYLPARPAFTFAPRFPAGANYV